METNRTARLFLTVWFAGGHFVRLCESAGTGPAAGSTGSLLHLWSLTFAAEQVKLIQDYGRTDILKLDR